MAGLLIRELLIRGDLQRCLIVCPGSLSVQWQDELFQKFHLPFEILTNDRMESARTGNAFMEIPLLICRLDQLSRNNDYPAKLEQIDWDLVVCDEAHKCSMVKGIAASNPSDVVHERKTDLYLKLLQRLLS